MNRWILLLVPLALGCAAAKEKALRDAMDRVWNDGDLSVIDEAYVPELAHEVRRFVEENRTLYPDIRVTMDDVIVRGNRYVSVWTVTGTHRDLGQEVTVQGVSVRTREGGQFTEETMIYDAKAVYDQLGFDVVPPEGVSPFVTRD